MEKRVAIGLLAACSIACGDKSTPAPSKEPVPSASPVTTTAPTASAAAPATIPVLALEKFTPAGSKPGALFAIEGALMVTEGPRVGRIVDDRIEWVGSVPAGSEVYGPSMIQSVNGRWPDGVGAFYTTSHGRAPMPTYHPVTGRGSPHTLAPGGGGAHLIGVATIGDSTLLAGYTAGDTGAALVTVRGPRLVRRRQGGARVGCAPGEVRSTDEADPAMSPEAIEATATGTLVSLGRLCDKRGPAAEVWDKAGESRIIELDRLWKKMHYSPKLLKGEGDELWAYSDPWNPVLRYHKGAFEPVAQLERPMQNVFVSESGKLHAYDGQTIHRYEAGHWTPVARLAEPKELRTLAVEKDTFWAADTNVHKLRETARGPAAEDCRTWFVYLYEAADKNEPKFTYPATRKGLSTFPQVADLGLVELKQGFNRHLGITVTSKAQGEAVMAHVKATMPDEDPKLFCFEPKDYRKIEMAPKGK